MSALTIPTPPLISTVQGPRPLQWTCDEFHRIGDLGAFEGRRAMLIDGVILEEGPMNPPHAITLELVENVLRRIFGAGWRIRSQSPLVLGQQLDPEPDFAIIAGSPRDQISHPTTAELIIEVSDSSLDFDLNNKRLLYAQAGIREYWVVDINGRKLHVFRDPRTGDYASPQVFVPTDSVTPLAVNTPVRVADLFV